MASLPFLVQPAPRRKIQIGNEQSGIVEVEVRGGLTVYESATISQLLASEQSAFVEGARMADHIAKEEGISLTEAFGVLESAVTGVNLDPATEQLRLKHADRIQQLIEVYSRAGQRNMEATVTALIRSRMHLPEWSIDDTRTMDRVLFNGLWKLAQEEQEAESLPTERPTEEDLGKPPAVEGAAAKRTGRKSSGN